MINHFLTYLDNVAEPPGDVLWPKFTPRLIGPDEQDLRDEIIGAGIGRREHFLRCVQLTYLVSNSPFVDAITAVDPRVTYSKEALRDLYRLTGAVVQASGTNPLARLVFGARSTTPDVARWILRITTAGGGTGTMAYSDADGLHAVLPFTYGADVSSVIELPNEQGVVTLYGTSFDVGDSWTINYQGDINSWVGSIFHRIPAVDPSDVLTPALLRQFKAAPLAIDKLAAVAAGLGGYAP